MSGARARLNALRNAVPRTGKSASASDRGSRRADALRARSMGGANARDQMGIVGAMSDCVGQHAAHLEGSCSPVRELRLKGGQLALLRTDDQRAQLRKLRGFGRSAIHVGADRDTRTTITSGFGSGLRHRPGPRHRAPSPHRSAVARSQ